MKSISALSIAVGILANIPSSPRMYRLQRIDRTIAYRGWVPDMVRDGMRVLDFWAVSDEKRGDVGGQAVYITTAWVEPGQPISYVSKILFEYDDQSIEDAGASARMLPSEVVAHFTAYLAERKFQL